MSTTLTMFMMRVLMDRLELCTRCIVCLEEEDDSICNGEIYIHTTTSYQGYLYGKMVTKYVTIETIVTIVTDPSLH